MNSASCIYYATSAKKSQYKEAAINGASENLWRGMKIIALVKGRQVWYPMICGEAFV